MANPEPPQANCLCCGNELVDKMPRQIYCTSCAVFIHKLKRGFAKERSNLKVRIKELSIKELKPAALKDLSKKLAELITSGMLRKLMSYAQIDKDMIDEIIKNLLGGDE